MIHTNASIIKRLEAMESKLLSTGPSYVLVEMADGTQAETTISEYAERRHEMRFIKFTRGFDPKYRDVRQMFSIWDELARDG